MKISILGCGVFGSALNNLFTEKRHTVYLEKIEDAEIIFVAVPSYAVMSVLLNSKNEITTQKIVICSKGFSEGGELLSEIIQKEFPDNEIMFLYGPALAREIEQGKWTAMVLAGQSQSKKEIKKQIESGKLYIEISDDIVGVQVASALKNVVTIFIGIIEGAKLGQNLRAFIFTKGVQAMRDVGLSLGAKEETFLGLTCLGDLTLDSRNRALGVELGQGKKVEEFTPEIGSPQEGLATLKIIKKISDNNYFNVLYSIVFKNLSIKEGIKNLIN